LALSEAGFVIVSGGGPGIVEAANKGAYDGKSSSIGLNIMLPHEKQANRYQNIGLAFRNFFAREVMFVKYPTAYFVMPGGFGTLNELIEDSNSNRQRPASTGYSGTSTILAGDSLIGFKTPS